MPLSKNPVDNPTPISSRYWPSPGTSPSPKLINWLDVQISLLLIVSSRVIDLKYYLSIRCHHFIALFNLFISLLFICTLDLDIGIHFFIILSSLILATLTFYVNCWVLFGKMYALIASVAIFIVWSLFLTGGSFDYYYAFINIYIINMAQLSILHPPTQIP